MKSTLRGKSADKKAAELSNTIITQTWVKQRGEICARKASDLPAHFHTNLHKMHTLFSHEKC